jgi:hypothetical protein
MPHPVTHDSNGKKLKEILPRCKAHPPRPTAGAAPSVTPGLEDGAPPE